MFYAHYHCLYKLEVNALKQELEQGQAILMHGFPSMYQQRI
jgi:exonuclease VII large subunit